VDNTHTYHRPRAEPDARKAVEHTIEWLHDWACTRDVRSYTIAHYLQNAEKYGIRVENIDDAFFDYVFYGKGDPEEIAKRVGTTRDIMDAMRREFEYWYPVDLRSTGKDLLQNHVTFSIFHHAAIFPGKHIRRWTANGWVLLNGQKMSKSSGNFITIIQAQKRWGADATRFAEAYSGNVILEDANFDTTIAEEVVSRWNP